MTIDVDRKAMPDMPPIEIYTAAVSSTVSPEYFPGPVIDINQNFY